MGRKRGYRIGEEVVDRKHTWLPCILNAQLDGASDEEVARLLKATWWADLITNAEWPALLDRPEGTRANRSRLKRKAVGWYMALGRIAAVNPELFGQIVADVRQRYLEQLGEPHPTLGAPEPVAAGARGDSPAG
jgi:hypothetical protein